MIAALSLGIVLLALGFVPLLGGPRYEAALLAGLLAPAWALVAASFRASAELQATTRSVQNDRLPRRVPLSRFVFVGCSVGAIMTLAVLVVAVIHGLRSGPCEPLEGFVLLVLGPGIGTVLAGVLGAMIGIFIAVFFASRSWASRVLTLLLALALPLGTAGFELLAFYDSPTVYAYDTFAGYFGGPLYDATEFELVRLLTFRAGSLGLLLCLGSVVSMLRLSWDEQGRRRLSFLEGDDSWPPRRAMLAVFAGAGLSVCLGVWSHAKELHLEATTDSIRQELGRTTSRSRCHVHFSASVAAREATRLARECEGHLSQLGRYFEVQPPGRVDVYLFANVQEKRRLIGAGRTNVAKPWRKEVYVTSAPFPHPVLGHELAHIVAGEFGSGPFRVAGMMGGLIPDPGRVEGFAEAASVREGSHATLRVWAAAMRQADLLPPLEELFRLSFFGSVASKAYTAAGAFVEYLRERSGPEALRRWYAGEGLQDVTGTEASILEQEFLAYLHATEVPEEVAVLASVRFSRPGVFQRRCPHAVDRKIRGASDACGAQPDKARRLIAEAVRLDPVRAGEEVWLPHCAWLSGNEKEAGEQYEKIVADQERYAPHELRAAWESLGDLRWNQGQIPKAKKAYEAALKVPQGQDARRQSEVKLWGLSQAGLPGEALRTTLAPRPDQQELAVLKLAEWQSKGPQSAFATYLLSRGALFEGRSDEALRLASQFQPGALPLASVQKEGGRTKVLIACLHAMRTGNDEPLKSWIKEYEATKPSAIGLSELSRLTERCLTPEAMK